MYKEQNMKQKFLKVLGLGAISLMSNADPVFFEPTPYVQFLDSPFSTTSFDYFYLEDFEDGVFNVPGASVSPLWVTSIGSSVYRDSVDADDGVIDGTNTGRVGLAFFF